MNFWRVASSPVPARVSCDVLTSPRPCRPQALKVFEPSPEVVIRAFLRRGNTLFLPHSRPLPPRCLAVSPSGGAVGGASWAPGCVEGGSDLQFPGGCRGWNGRAARPAPTGIIDRPGTSET